MFLCYVGFYAWTVVYKWSLLLFFILVVRWRFYFPLASKKHQTDVLLNLFNSLHMNTASSHIQGLCTSTLFKVIHQVQTVHDWIISINGSTCPQNTKPTVCCHTSLKTKTQSRKSRLKTWDKQSCNIQPTPCALYPAAPSSPQHRRSPAPQRTETSGCWSPSPEHTYSPHDAGMKTWSWVSLIPTDHQIIQRLCGSHQVLDLHQNSKLKTTTMIRSTPAASRLHSLAWTLLLLSWRMWPGIRNRSRSRSRGDF